jgi:hypothetical protein
LVDLDRNRESRKDHIMSIISRTSTARANPNAPTARRERQPSEFDGFYLNAGPCVEADEGEDPRFLRLNRGIALSDLVMGKIYPNMSEEFASDTAILNDVIESLQERAREMEDGESVVVNLELRLYKTQKEAEVTKDPEAKKAMRKNLFG